MGKYRIIGKKGWKWQKKISNENQDNGLIDFLRNNPFQTAVEAHNQTNFPGTVRTAINRIKKNSELRNKVPTC